MAPERLRSEQYAAAADVWSLGLTCVALCTGGNPLGQEAEKGGFFGVLSAVGDAAREWGGGDGVLRRLQAVRAAVPGGGRSGEVDGGGAAEGRVGGGEGEGEGRSSARYGPAP